MTTNEQIILYAFASYEAQQQKEHEKEMERYRTKQNAKSLSSSRPARAGRKSIPTRRR